MKLNLMERLTLLQILPKEGSYVTLKVIRDLQSELAPNEDEFIEFEIKQEGEKASWNEKGREEKEIELGIKSEELIKDALERLDRDKKLTFQHLSLFAKFIEDK